MNIAPLYNWAMSIKATSALGSIANFGGDIQAVVDNYVAGRSLFASTRANFLRLVNDAFEEIARQAWADGGRQMSELLQSELSATLSEQRAYAQAALDRIREQVSAAGGNVQGIGAGTGARWAAGLWGEYNYWRALALSGTTKLLFWVLGATEKHCPTCLTLSRGGGHTADWYIRRGYIPGRNGAAMYCGGYNCDCSWVDAAGHDVSLTG